MSDFDLTKLRRLDLTVLLVFAGLMRHGKATSVAEELGLTNSSISHALRRLRDVFADELFIRRPHGLEPTAFARGIEPEVQSALESLQHALIGPAAFDPLTSDVHVRFAGQDYETVALLPAFMARLQSEAPRMTVSIRSLSKADALKALDVGDIDVALGFFPQVGTKHVRHFLLEETYLLAAEADHPILRLGATLDRYLATNHVLVSPDDTMSGIVDTVLAQRGLRRRVALSVPFFLSALAVLPATNAIATLPSAVVRDHAPAFGLGYCEPPISVRPFQVHAVRHVRDEKNSMISWIIDRLQAASSR